MISYEDIRAYHEAGDSAATILGKLQADTRHKRDIKATGATPAEVAKGQYDLLHVLRSQLRVLRIGSSAEWKGPLVDYFEGTPPTDAAQLAQFNAMKEGFEELLTSLQLTGQMVYCGSDAATGFLVTAMTQLIGTLTGDAAGVKTRIDALTGGVIYAGVTLSDVQAVIDANIKETASISLMAEYDVQFNLQISDALSDGNRSSLVAGLRAMASALEAN